MLRACLHFLLALHAQAESAGMLKAFLIQSVSQIQREIEREGKRERERERERGIERERCRIWLLSFYF
jgi:hypothetical protein